MIWIYILIYFMSAAYIAFILALLKSKNVVRHKSNENNIITSELHYMLGIYDRNLKILQDIKDKKYILSIGFVSVSNYSNMLSSNISTDRFIELTEEMYPLLLETWQNTVNENLIKIKELINNQIEGK